MSRLNADDPFAALPAGADRLVRDLREAGLDAAGSRPRTGLPAEVVRRLLARDELEQLLREPLNPEGDTR